MVQQHAGVLAIPMCVCVLFVYGTDLSNLDLNLIG